MQLLTTAIRTKGLIKYERPNNDKIYLHFKELFESKYQLLINGREKIEIKELKIPKAKISKIYPQKIDDIYNNLEDYNPTKKRKVLFMI